MPAIAENITLKLEYPIEYLKLPERAYNALLDAGVSTIRDVYLEIQQDSLLAIKGVGLKMASEITKKMKDAGYGKNLYNPAK